MMQSSAENSKKKIDDIIEQIESTKKNRIL